MLEIKQIDLAIEIAFENASERWSSHRHHIETLTTNYHRSKREDFYRVFIKYLELILMSSQEINPIMNNSLQFVAQFINQLEDDDNTCPFLMKIFDFLCQKHDAERTEYRASVCCLFDLLMNGINDFVLTKKMYKKMTDVLLTRMNDDSPEVRVQAINALQRLQEPKEKECIIENAYINKLSNDPSPNVKKVIIKNLRRNKKCIDAVIKQLESSNENIKREAYLFLCKMTPSDIDAKNCHDIIKNGLNDCDKIVNIIKRMLLPIWYPNYIENILDFLKNLDVSSDPVCCNIIFESVLPNISLDCLLKQLPIDPKTKSIPIDLLTIESVFFWASLINYFLKLHDMTVVGLMLPELTQLCIYINDFKNIAINRMKNDSVQSKDLFILSQLIDITERFNLFNNETGCLSSLLDNILSSDFYDAHFIVKIVEYYKHLVTDVPSRIDNLSRIIGRIQRPTVPPVGDNNDELGLEDADEEKLDTKTMLKCLAITHIMMQGSPVTEISPAMKNIFNEIILPSVDHENSLVQGMSIKTIGSWLLLNRFLAKKHFRRLTNFFFIISDIPSEKWLLVLNIIFSLLEKYGLDFFGLEINDDINMLNKNQRDITINLLKSCYSNENILKFLVGLVDYKVPEIKNAAVEGFQRLIDQGKIQSSWIIMRLAQLKNELMVIENGEEPNEPGQSAMINNDDFEIVEKLDDIRRDKNSETPVMSGNKKRKRRILSKSLGVDLAINTEKIKVPKKEIVQYSWRGSIKMPDIDDFSVQTREIYGSLKYVIRDLPDILSIIGFIDHEYIWKCIAEIQKTNSNEILVICLVPESGDDENSYITSHSYLNSQGKSGVVDNDSAHIKDFYIIPLSSETMIPKNFLSLIGDELQRDESEEILLGIIVLQSKKRLSTPETPISLVCHEEFLDSSPQIPSRKRRSVSVDEDNSSVSVTSADLSKSTLSEPDDFDASNGVNSKLSTPRSKRLSRGVKKVNHDYVYQPLIKKKKKILMSTIKKEKETEQQSELTRSVKKEIKYEELPELKVVLMRLDEADGSVPSP